MYRSDIWRTLQNRAKNHRLRLFQLVSFFPFVEPAIEFDLTYKGKWIEMGGAGMVHPKVLENCGIDSEKYQGFAFGPGLERLMVIKYVMPDIRDAYHGDLRFNQF